MYKFTVKGINKMSVNTTKEGGRLVKATNGFRVHDGLHLFR